MEPSYIYIHTFNASSVGVARVAGLAGAHGVVSYDGAQRMRAARARLRAHSVHARLGQRTFGVALTSDGNY